MYLNKLKILFLDNKEIFILSIIFIILYCFNLDKFPHLWLDEAYFSNPAYNLAIAGNFGTSMSYGLYNIANITYWQPPVYFLLLASSFKVFGFGLFQGRIVSVFLGLITVIFTYLLSKELFNKKIAILASIFLIANPFFFFICREIRMDIAVACFGLMAVFFIVLALRRSNPIYYFCSSFFSILAILSHWNGLISIITVLAIIFIYKTDWRNKRFDLRSKEILYLTLGMLIPLIPYLLFISLDLNAFLGQFMTNIQTKSSVLQNIILEASRYDLLLQYLNISLNRFYQSFLIINSILIVLALYLNIYKKNRNGLLLIFIILLQIFLFAILVSRKSYWYLGIILPFWTILIASPFFNLNLKHKLTLKKVLAVLLIIGYISLSFYGIYNLINLNKGYNYREIENEINQYIPQGSTILGPGDYWINLHDKYKYYDFRRFPPEAVRQYHIQYILYDSSWISEDTLNFKTFLNQNCTLIGEIKNSNIELGPIKIYKVN